MRHKKAAFNTRALLISTSVSLLLLAAGAVTSIPLLLFAAGLSIAAFHAPAPAMIAKVSGSRVGTGMSIFMAAGELARAIGPLFVAAGVVWFGMDGIWRLAIFGWLVSIFLYFRLRKVPATPRGQGQASLTDFWPQARRVFPPLVWLLSGRIFMMAALTTYLPIFVSDVREGGLWLAAASLTILEAAGVETELMLPFIGGERRPAGELGRGAPRFSERRGHLRQSRIPGGSGVAEIHAAYRYAPRHTARCG